VAEARRDENAAIVTMGYVGMLHAASGSVERATDCLRESLRRAEQSKHPVSIQAAVLTAVGPHLFGGGEPDLEASLQLLTRDDVRVDDSMAMYRDVFLGATLAALHREGSVQHLARAIRSADRSASHDAGELALTFLAIAAAGLGYGADAATLAGYATANTTPYSRLHGPGYHWVLTLLQEVLSTVTDRDVHEVGGAVMSRRQIMALVTQLDALTVR